MAIRAGNEICAPRRGESMLSRRQSRSLLGRRLLEQRSRAQTLLGVRMSEHDCRSIHRRMSLQIDPIRSRSCLRCDLLPLQSVSAQQRRPRACLGRCRRRCFPPNRGQSKRLSNFGLRAQPLLRKVWYRTVRRVSSANSPAGEEWKIFLDQSRHVRRAGAPASADSSIHREQALVVRHNRRSAARRGQHPSAPRQTQTLAHRSVRPEGSGILPTDLFTPWRRIA